MSKRNRIRRGDTMVVVEVETESAVVDYNELIDSATTKHDDNYVRDLGDNDEGLAHELQNPPHDDSEEASAYVQPERHRSAKFIVLDHDYRDAYDYARARGASRQVAAELIAKYKRDTISRIRRWYENDWNYVGVVVKFGDDYVESLWGIESDCDDYIEEVKRELADQMVDALERDGYTVTNKPEQTTKRTRVSHVNDFNTCGR